MNILAGAEEIHTERRSLSSELSLRCAGRTRIDAAVKERLITYNENKSLRESDPLIELIQEILETHRLVHLEKQQHKMDTDSRLKKRVRRAARSQ